MPSPSTNPLRVLCICLVALAATQADAQIPGSYRYTGGQEQNYVEVSSSSGGDAESALLNQQPDNASAPAIAPASPSSIAAYTDAGHLSNVLATGSVTGASAAAPAAPAPANSGTRNDAALNPQH